MSRPAPLLRHWLRRAVPALALAGLAGLCLAAWWAQPERTMIALRPLDLRPGVVQVECPLPDAAQAQGSISWRLLLRVEAASAVGDWQMGEARLSPPSEGPLRAGMPRQPAVLAGYALAWRANDRVLLVWRSQPEPLLLCSRRCQRPPREVGLERHGDRLRMQVRVDDGTTFATDLHDPTPPPPARGWLATGDLGGHGASWEVHHRRGDQETLLARSEQAQALNLHQADAVLGPNPSPHDLLRLGLGQMYRRQAEAAATLAQARAGLAASADASQQRRLGAWLAWAQARLALADTSLGVARRTNACVDAITALTGGERSLEVAPGLALDLALRLHEAAEATLNAQAARQRGLVPVLRDRDNLLRAAETTLRLLSEEPAPDSDDAAALALNWQPWRTLGASAVWELRLYRHALMRLGVFSKVLPLPAQAPPWVGERWRLLSAQDPATDLLAALPTPAPCLLHLRSALEAAIEANAALPPAAVGARARIQALVAERAEVEQRAKDAGTPAPPLDAAWQDRIERALVGCPAREAALLRGLLARRGLADARLASAALRGAANDPNPLRHADDDPLAWALLAAIQAAREPGSPLNALGQGLGNERELLSGRPDSHLAALDAPPSMRARHAAAALLVQQLARPQSPTDTSLLDRLPCALLPVHLISETP